MLVYAAGPQFYGFDSQYAYESLALAFGAAVVYLLLVSIDAPRPRKGGLFALALSCVAAVVITHHVTGWLTVGFLVVWAGALYLTTRSRRYRAPDVGEQSVISEDRRTVQVSTVSGHEQRSRRSGQARIIGIAAAVGLVVGGAWTALVGRRLIDYVGPVFAAASDNINQLLGNLHGNRQLFKNAAGGGSPKWEILLILASSVCFCLILVPSLYSVIFKRSVRGGALRYLPAVIAATYPISVLANVSSYSKLVAERADTFIFFGVAVVVGAWLAGRISRRRRMLERIATIAVATVCFLGSLLFGAGPLATLLPGPYRVGADELSLGSPSLAVAHWADTHLPAGSHVAADRDNAALLNAIGGVVPVTAEGGLVNPASLFFDRRLSPFDISLIRQADIRYVVVDDRLAEGLPLYGIYVAYGEPHARLTLEELNKFSSYRGIKRIYDNGPIQVYDLSRLFPTSPQAAPAGAPVGGSGLDVGAFVLFVLVAVLWMLRLRRRTEPFRHVEHLAVCGLVGALVVGVFGAFLVRLTRAPPDAVAFAVLLVLLALSLRPKAWHLSELTNLRRRSDQPPETPPFLPRVVDGPHAQRDTTAWDTLSTATTTSPRHAVSPTGEPGRTRRSRRQVVLGCLGLALFALGASLATVAALKEWTPPPELSVVSGTTGRPAVEVQLGSAGPIAAELQVRNAGRTVWRSGLARTTAAQRVDLPARVLDDDSRVSLVADGHTLRVVSG